MLAYLLRSSEYNGRMYLGVSAEGLQSSLILLKDTISHWDKDSDIAHIEDTRNTSLLEALNTELYNVLLRAGTIDEIETSTAFAILRKLGPRSWGGSRGSRAKYLIESLRKPLTRQDQLVRLALLPDALWSDQDDWFFDGIDAYVDNIHMRDVLATTMWGVDGKPDLDHRRVVLRLKWFCKDNGMYPKFQDLDLGRYLALWLKSDVHPDPSIPSERVRGCWYLRTVIRLLLRDQERWAKELGEHGHLTHIEAITLDQYVLLTTQPLAFIMFAYVAGRNDDPNAPPSQYYSQARVDRVVQQLRDFSPPLIRYLIRDLQPNHVDSIYQSISGYIKMAYQYKRIPDYEFYELSQRVKTSMDYFRRR
ncbi:hypothetical protein FRC02_000419 [Tulasnella sp. 418]|nr:hypothetical protein FRC02_000419 [Tulasnella sp. 418]